MSAKETNPKDAIGSSKLPLSLVPPTMIAEAAIAFQNGAAKYGLVNWRAAGVRASVYVDAALRHLYAWQSGEECDPEDGVSNLAAVLACIGIIIDSRAAGKLTDDRPLPVGLRAEFDRLTPHVGRLKEMHKDRKPKHWTIADLETARPSAASESSDTPQAALFFGEPGSYRMRNGREVEVWLNDGPHSQDFPLRWGLGSHDTAQRNGWYGMGGRTNELDLVERIA